MNSTTEHYFDEIVDNFIKLVQAVHEVGDKVQMKRLTYKRDQLCQVISLIEPLEKNHRAKRSKFDPSEEEDDTDNEEYEPWDKEYHPNDPEAFEGRYGLDSKDPQTLKTIFSKEQTLKKLNLTMKYPLETSKKLNFPKLKYLWISSVDTDCLEKFAQAKLPSLERLRIGTRSRKGDLEYLAQNCNQFLANAPNLKSIQLGDCDVEQPISKDALSNLYDIFAENGVLVYLGTVFDTSSQDQLDKFIFHDRYDDRDPKVFVKYEQMLRKFISWCRKNEKYGDINDVH